MSGIVSRQWGCQNCGRTFTTEDDLAEHIEAYRSRVHDLMIELQLALAHSDSNIHHDDQKVRDNGRGLFCPHRDCQHKPPYALLKSLQRHYRSHVRCNVTCPSCLIKFKIVRKYETHLPSCLKKQEEVDKKDEARRVGRRLHKNALYELERKISPTEAKRGHGNTNFEKTMAHRQIEGGLIDTLVVDSTTCSTTCVPEPIPQALQPAHLASATLGENSDINLRAAYPMNDSALLPRYTRGPALSCNPMEWSHTFSIQPPYMVTPDTGAAIQYSHTSLGPVFSQVGGGNMEAL